MNINNKIDKISLTQMLVFNRDLIQVDIILHIISLNIDEIFTANFYWELPRANYYQIEQLIWKYRKYSFLHNLYMDDSYISYFYADSIFHHKFYWRHVNLVRHLHELIDNLHKYYDIIDNNLDVVGTSNWPTILNSFNNISVTLARIEEIIRTIDGRQNIAPQVKKYWDKDKPKSQATPSRNEDLVQQIKLVENELDQFILVFYKLIYELHMVDRSLLEVQPSAKPTFIGLVGATTILLAHALKSRQKEAVYFNLYCPDSIQVDKRYSMVIYAFVEKDLNNVRIDVKKFAPEFGGQVNEPAKANRHTKIRPDSLLNIVPEADGIIFNPPQMAKKWTGEWVRFPFDLITTSLGDNSNLSIRVSMCISGIEISNIKKNVRIIPKMANDGLLNEATNPLARAKLTSHISEIYNKIFISYSRKDADIVKLYRLAQIALGNEVFLDVESIPPGINWQTALARAIDSADIFQLFWSENSAKSINVRDEWDYALKYKCAETNCENFIRPVYWKKPINPPPPAELSHLNFKYVPLNDFNSLDGYITRPINRIWYLSKKFFSGFLKL